MCGVQAVQAATRLPTGDIYSVSTQSTPGSRAGQLSHNLLPGAEYSRVAVVVEQCRAAAQHRKQTVGPGLVLASRWRCGGPASPASRRPVSVVVRPGVVQVAAPV